MNTKDTYWFRHDSNAKDDFKCMLLIEQLGPEGYGIFWILVETLRDQKDYRYPFALLGALSRKYNTTQAKMETVVKEYGLFKIDDKDFFFSLSFNNRMKALDEIKEKRRLAGKKSGEARRKNQIEHKSNKCSTNDELLDKSIEEEIITEIEKLHQLYQSKSSNAILEIQKYGDYKDMFSKEMVSFIENNGGLVQTKSIIDDISYRDWIKSEITKFKENK